MEPLHHREPGVIGSVLTSSDLYFSVIADNIHLHPTILNLAWRCNPQGLILVTDAMEALGLGDGIYSLGAKKVFVKDGKAVIEGTETIAGSVISLDEAVRNLYKITGCSIVDAVEAASFKPATLLGIADRKGTLEVGADADFIILDDSLHIRSCFIARKQAYLKE